ncbi:MAG: M28 family peptidase [Thermodesulfobacteriota bacterium]
MEKHISWFDAKEKELEKKIVAAYSSDNVRKHLEFLAALTRRPGTEDELKAAQYIKGRLDEYGIDGKIYEFDAYVGHVGDAQLEILSPVQKSFPSEPRVFTAPTPPEGIEGELILVGRGLPEDYQGVDVRGKIVLMEPGGLAGARMPASRLAEEKGAIAQIHIADGKSRDIHMGQIRFTWGNPTPDTIRLVPQTPLISICNEDGRSLRELAKEARVVARIKTNARRGYTRVREPIGTLKGTKEPENFVLFGGHYCSWYKGATDNAAANSLMLEMARIFSEHRKSLGRSIKFAWWPCHEQGTYAGSTWFVDNFWDDIRDHAVAYIVVDGLGRAESPGFVPKYIEPRNSEEIRKFNEMILKKLFGLEVRNKRLNKSGDQSFWGMGLPSFFGKPDFKAGEDATVKGAPIWYSHTPEDTLDKVDLQHLFRIPFRLTATSILRLCNNPVLPFEFVAVADAYEKRLNDLEKEGRSVLDLTSLMPQVKGLRRNAARLNQEIKKNLSILEKGKSNQRIQNRFKEINACLMELSRILMPLLSSKGGRYGQDPMGFRFKSIPGLEQLEHLHSMDSASEEYKAWYTFLLRERNKLSDAFELANHLLGQTLSAL